jgi:fatty acid desaturase
VSGGKLVAWMLGGLNYQIEHHLFPTMPRPNLARAQVLVRNFCAEYDLDYRQETLIGSHRLSLRYLNNLGAVHKRQPAQMAVIT